MTTAILQPALAATPVVQPRRVVSATIASGASVSQAIDLANSSLAGILTPAAWTAAGLAIEVSTDGTTWYVPYDNQAFQVFAISSATAAVAYSTDPANWLAWRYIRLRSGTSASPVNQGADRVFSVITRPLA